MRDDGTVRFELRTGDELPMHRDGEEVKRKPSEGMAAPYALLWEKPCGCKLYRIDPEVSAEIGDVRVFGIMECAEHEFVQVLQSKGKDAVR